MQLTDANDRRPTGDFYLEVRVGGVLTHVVDEKNIVVDNSKQIHARMLGGDVTGRSIQKIAFGTGTTPAAPGNTTITNSFAKDVDLVTYPADNKVRFAFSLASGEANGKAISEFGLLTASGLLYARKVRATPINKESDISLSGTWTINF